MEENMSFRFSLFIVLSTFLAALCWFSVTAKAQDDYYTCYAPDGTWFQSSSPCDYYNDYDYPYFDYGYPGGLYFNFHRDHHHRDFERGEGSFRGRERGERGFKSGGGRVGGSCTTAAMESGNVF